MAVLIGVCCCWFLLYFFSFNFFVEFILFLFAALRARCVPVRDALQARTKCSACCDANWRPKARAMNGNGTRLLSPHRWCCWRCRCCCCLGHGAGKQFVSFPRCSCGAKFYAEFWWESEMWERMRDETIRANLSVGPCDGLQCHCQLSSSLLLLLLSLLMMLVLRCLLKPYTKGIPFICKLREYVLY